MITSENYVENVLRTDAVNEQMLERLSSVETVRLLHAAIGMCTESAELLDMLKKHIFYGKPIDWVNAKEEVGDNQWYVGLAIDVMRTTMNEVLTVNINKLKLRYPEKFTESDAIKRDIVAERELLEETSKKVEYAVTITEPFVKYTQRGKDWLNFAYEVLKHIENYTVPQYGDSPDDQIEKYSIATCLQQVEKYINRYGKVTEERQQKDFLKMVHYVQCACVKHTALSNG